MLHTQCKTELDLQNQSSFSKDHTHLSSKLRENKKTAELIKTANLLFNSFEPSYMWDYIACWFEECCRFVFGNNIPRHAGGLDNPELSLMEFCQLVDFLLDVVSLETYIEIQTEHLPQLLLRMVAALTCHLQTLGLGELTHCLRLCSKILSKVQPPLVSPLALPTSPQVQGLSSCCGDSSDSTKEKKSDNKVNGEVFKDVETHPNCSSESCFTEFIQYHESVPDNEQPPHTHPINKTGLRSSGLSQPKPVDKPVMQCCLEHFQQFLSRLITLHITTEQVDKDEKDRGLLVQTTSLAVEGTPHCRHVDLTESCLDSVVVQKECVAAFTAACQLFLECSSFPVYIAEGNQKASPTQDEQGCLPVWLQTLMDATCLASDFSLQGVAISLLMDLVGLTQSVAMVTAESVASSGSSESAQPMSPSQGRVAVVIRPPLTQGILLHIANKTDFFKNVALILWDQLSEGTPQHHQRSVELFYQLHNLVPSSSICEDVISQQLMHRDKVSAVKISCVSAKHCVPMKCMLNYSILYCREFGSKPM
uniref:Uncharacterized protein n=1 Tax=Hippocampus comes TaxID=109280 RepID=A0A3Q2Y2T3_HIPCM